MMKHEARYCVVRYMPDPIRGEFANIGIVLQSEFGVSFRLLPYRLRRRTFAEVPLRELQIAEEILEAVFGRDARLVRIRREGKAVTLEKTQPEYLDYCRRLLSQTIRLTEVRTLTLEFHDPYLLEEHLVSLFELLVVPPPRPREYVLPRERRLRPIVKRDFQLWEVYDKVEKDSVLFGTIPWKMDYTYSPNGREVGLRLVDFGWKEVTHVVGEAWAAWMDMVQEKSDTTSVRAVFGNYNQQDNEHRTAMRLLRKIEILYNYDKPMERTELESKLREELSIRRRLE